MLGARERFVQDGCILPVRVGILHAARRRPLTAPPAAMPRPLLLLAALLLAALAVALVAGCAGTPSAAPTAPADAKAAADTTTFDPSVCLADTARVAEVDLKPSVQAAVAALREDAGRDGDYADFLDATHVQLKFDLAPPAADEMADWTPLPGGGRVWCARLATPTHKGASLTGALRLRWADADPLPSGATLAVLDDAGRRVPEALPTAAPDASVCFRDCADATPRTALVLAYHVPPDAAAVAPPRLVGADHLFDGRDRLNASLPCHLNARPDCPDATPWADALRAAVQVVRVNYAGGRLAGSGVLLNNTRHDRTPYVLTVRHRAGPNGLGTDLNARGNRWFFRFGHEADACGTAPARAAATGHAVTGGRVVATQARGVQFMLVRLAQPVPDAWRPVYAGWARDGRVPPQAAFVGYPAGDVRAMAFEDDPLGTRRDVWTARLDRGAVEGGLSGAPIFDDRALVVGHLTNGTRACRADRRGRAPYASGTRLDAIWDLGAPGARVRDFLDPDRTGAQTLSPLVVE
jgi:hypothetical protein